MPIILFYLAFKAMLMLAKTAKSLGVATADKIEPIYSFIAQGAKASTAFANVAGIFANS